MKKIPKERKLNNAGLTLVELLIAMFILAIVVTPILKNFVSSARVNNKSRHTMNATELCETLMEEFESRKVSEMVDVLVNDYGYGAPVVDPAHENIYSVTGVETLLSGTEYKVTITLNGYNTYDTLNNQMVYDIQNFAGGTNAIYVDNASKAEYAATYFEANSSKSKQEIAKSIYKEVEIDIDADYISLAVSPTENMTVPVYEVRSRCYYVCDDRVALDDPAKDKYPADGSEMLIFSNEEELRKLAQEVVVGTKKKEDIISRLDNILVCHIPTPYAGADLGGFTKPDKVSVNNTDNVETNIVLVEQNVDVTTYLHGYGDTRLQYELMETHNNWGPGLEPTTTAYAKLRSNVVFVDSTRKQIKLHNAKNGYSASGNDAYAMLAGDDVAPKMAMNRLYDISIDVFDNKTGEKVLTMTGTVTD